MINYYIIFNGLVKLFKKDKWNNLMVVCVEYIYIYMERRIKF